ncbi:MAG: hypothetical protein ACM3JD_18070, partial [Rudaea sp.]
HSISLHRFARDGIVLLGHFQAVQDGVASLAPDLTENIVRADAGLREQLKMIDAYIDRSGLVAPREEDPELNDGYMPPFLAELNLREAGIGSVIWAGGFRFDYRWVKPAALDEFGFPRAGDGAANVPGLYFVGLPWLPRFSTGLLSGTAEVASAIAEGIAKRAVPA